MRLARFPAFSLDWCRPCTLLWFDRNELESLPSLPVPEAPPPLSPEATAALAEFYRSQRPREVTVGDVVRTTASQVGLPVEVEAPPLRWFPAMTAGLSALLLIGWLSEASAARFALTGFGIDLLRYPFARTGFVTLAANLYLLWLFGDNVEDLLGLGRYLALFGGAGVVAGLFHLGLGPATPLAGATPSIVALAVFYAARFPRARLRAAGLELPAWGGVIVSALAVSAIGWIFREFSLVSLLGGALAGLVAAGPELLRGMEARRGGSLRGRPSGSGG
jgi:membrane associated rhomboid family serine protease